MKKLTSLLLLLFAMTPKNLFAHPGHEIVSDPGSAMHYLIEPAHLIPVLAGLVLIVIGVFAWRKFSQGEF